jgi:hypothetical protein
MKKKNLLMLVPVCICILLPLTGCMTYEPSYQIEMKGTLRSVTYYESNSECVVVINETSYHFFPNTHHNTLAIHNQCIVYRGMTVVLSYHYEGRGIESALVFDDVRGI